MDKITILLQDKQTIEKLAADPQMQIRIKDAIIDCVGKRALKISNVAFEITESARRQLKEEFFTGNNWSPVLKKEWSDKIRDKANTEAYALVSDELNLCREELKKAINSWKAEALSKLKEYDIDKAIREVAEKVIRDKFKS